MRRDYWLSALGGVAVGLGGVLIGHDLFFGYIMVILGSSYQAHLIGKYTVNKV